MFFDGVYDGQADRAGDDVDDDADDDCWVVESPNIQRVSSNLFTAYFKSSSTFAIIDGGVGFKNNPTRLECGNDAQPKPFNTEAMIIPKEQRVDTMNFKLT